MEGHGTLFLEGGGHFTGEWKKGKQNGKGEFESKDGKYTFRGLYKDAMRHGHGKECYKSGKSYVGGYVDDKRHGEGTETSKNGDVYKGQYAFG